MSHTKRAASTPGPWRFEPHPWRKEAEIYGSDGRLVCVLWAMDMAHQHANAHLIAAAPDLLEAARQVMLFVDGARMISHDDEPMVWLREAIAKAQGGDDGL